MFCSKSINGKQAAQLINKLNSGLSKYQRKSYNYIYKSNELSRTDNTEIFYTLELIEEAKRRGKRISFQYLTSDENGKPVPRRDGYRYIVSPYHSINSNGRYYLICNYREKYGAITYYRIDYMMNARIEEDWPIKELHALKELKSFDIVKYLNDNIYMLDGDVITAKLEIERPDTVQAITDWFGKNTKIYKKDGKLCADIKCNESALMYWYMQWSETLKIISPQHLIDRVKKEAERIVKKYE